MSNWDYAGEAELQRGREGYRLDDPKHPDSMLDYYPLDEEEQQMAIAPIQQNEVGVFAGDPAQQMQQIKETAQILAHEVRQFSIRIGKTSRPYVKVEGWTMLGRLVGVTPIVVWTRPMLNEQSVREGWEARVEARTRSGELVGAAEAECLRTETNWAKRDDYALRSMAQTRATAKALRGPLGFVMALAGYETTPAEEMPTSPQFQAPRPRDAQVDPDMT